MANEKMRVLDLLEAGKITADEAAKLLDALGGSRFMNKETRDNVEEKLQQFAKDMNRFAKDVGGKVQVFYKDVEPKIKKASQQALEKAAAALDSMASSLNESLEKGTSECCENAAEGETCCEEDKDTPKPN